MDHSDAASQDAEVQDAVPAAAPAVPIPPSAKRPRAPFTDEQKEAARRRSNLVGREVERRCRLGQPAPPTIATAARVNRGVAAYDNGINVIGVRVRAYNTIAQQWYLGTIRSVHMRKPVGQGVNPNAASFVIAVVEHDETPLTDRAYEVSCLELIPN